MRIKKIISLLFLGFILIAVLVSCSVNTSFKVKFVDWDDTILKTEEVKENHNASAPSDPSRIGYTFVGWNGDVSNITSSLTVKAEYTANYYTVTWIVNGNITQVARNLTYGVIPTYVGEKPTKPSDNGVSYFFNGWNPIVAPVTEDITYNATFESASLDYTVTYKDFDGKVIDTQTVGHGNAATNPSDPTRDGYTFSAWDTDTSYVTSSLTVTALYTINYYTVTWVVNGNVIQTDRNVAYGVTPAYIGAEPAKPTENGVSYIFNGWNPIVGPVREDTTYNATFKNSSLNYTVTYKDFDGSIIKTQTVGYGNAATNPSDPTREGYTFTSWDTDTSYITSSLTVTALYTINYYTVTWVVNGNVIQTDHNVTYGVTPTYIGAEPTKPTENGILYIWSGWNPIVGPVTEDITYNATFESFSLSYSVVYYDYDSSVIDTQTVGYGNAATNPSDPSRAGYTFAGWDTDTSYITSSVNVTALYSINYYTVSWVVNGNVIQTDHNVTYGVTPTYVGTTPTKP
ncbi:MAG: InlB B-repeat-containing protein, partial [Acholeplasmatales bacterium]|nr:InlB B-repeat-containing protein [Acholeplasmatales bacterium]